MKSEHILAIFVLILLIIGVYFLFLNKTDEPIVVNNLTNNTTMQNYTPPNMTTVCSDSDVNDDLFIMGSVTFNSTTKSDQCLNSTSLLQYNCVNNTVQSKSVLCPANYVCNSGACELGNTSAVTNECYDSDNGQFYEDTGVVTYNGSTYLDYCTAQDELQEYYCDNGNMEVAAHTCQSGQECMDGHCASVPTSCTDSDGGENKDAKGTVTIVKLGASHNFGTDECLNSVDVHEFFCDGNNPMDSVLSCEPDESCSNGKCVKNSQQQDTCEDPDGQDADIKGTTTKGSESHSDACVSPSRVEEFYCSGDNIVSKEMDCQTGFACTNGACTPSQSSGCTDSDGGDDNYVLGTTTGLNGQFTDYCHTNGNDVMEYYCDSSDNAQVKQMMCQVTGVCQNGACTTSSPTTCTETDGGKDELVKGTTTDSTGSNTDYCTPFGGLNEYYCDNGQMKSDVLMCSVGTCQNGVCTTSSPATCTETDNQQDINNFGSVTDNTGTYSDSCLDSSTVEEWYCGIDNLAKRTQLTCATGWSCLGGECIMTMCSDGDGSDLNLLYADTDPSIYTASSASDYTGSYQDSCSSPNNLDEFFCDSTSNLAQAYQAWCTFGCTNGACIQLQIQSCTDSDGGPDEFTFGTTTDLMNTYQDTCAGPQILTEYYCTGPNGAATPTTITCPVLCMNGQCS
ncbi:MAG: hypothetical protein ABH842_06245 [Candidatus Micrarchaeota archaeon]